MKKRGNTYTILTVILSAVIVLLIAGLIILWGSHHDLKKAFEEEKNREKRVYFIEEQTTMFKKDAGEFCADLCNEKRYDGLVKGAISNEGLSFFVYECECYRIVM